MSWAMYRFEACAVGTGTGTVIDTANNTPVGGWTYSVIAYAFSAYDNATWYLQLSLRQTYQWGVGVDGTTVHVDASCLGLCTLPVYNDFAPQPMVYGGYETGTIGTTGTPALGGSGSMHTTAGVYFTNPAWGNPSQTATVTTPTVRCDNATPGTTTPGCVFQNRVPWMFYSDGSLPTLESHIRQAQESGLPGGWLGRGGALHRTTVDWIKSDNRQTACPASIPRNGLDCDEYPFASTYEGAGNNGSPRSWPGCGFDSIPSATGPVGYSICLIDPNDNQKGGSQLSSFYLKNRIIDGDAFNVFPYYLGYTPKT